MVATTDPSKKEDLFLKSPRELFMLFSGGEVTTAKPKPDPIPDPIQETVQMVVKSASQANTVLTNLFGENGVLGAKQQDLVIKDPGLVCFKASVTIERQNVGGIDLANPVSDILELQQELINNHVTLQLVSNEVDPQTKSGKLSGKVTFEHWARARDLLIPTLFDFNMDFFVPKDFGVPGAILVNNGHKNLVLILGKITMTTEFRLVKAQVTMPDQNVIRFLCNSWVYASEMSKDGREGRIFFANKYTPAATPPGLLKLRQSELKEIQGDGTGERQEGDRIYDYDVYNDLGKPDDPRPTLGGSAEYPYPRRCRTGRALHPDGKTETRLSGALANLYIPRDERFDEVKRSGFIANNLKAKKHSIASTLFDDGLDFHDFDELRALYVPIGEESVVEIIVNNQRQPFELIRQFVKASGDSKNDSFLYPTPRIIHADKDAWSKDVEFARQVLAGMNPLIIEALKEFPLKRPSAVTAEMIVPQLEGLSISEALSKKKLFVLDYHERFLGYIKRINELKSSQAYASWTLFFLSKDGTLKPICIELALPGAKDRDRPIFRVFRPSEKDAGKNWAWELAKAHVQCNDASWHQVISHWMRTHAVIEPLIIATNRQLSIMHPVHKALVTHYKNTMDINQSARKALINAGGIVEQTFAPQKYTMEISSKVYAGWRFIDQALPNDLIKRGMAVPDPTAPYGLKLVIDDYPYAKDGLDLWAAIRTWVKEHIDIFYADDKAVQGDVELQSWWSEARTKGHADITEGWIMADSKDNLVQIVTTIAWVASCHHAAVNFGQYLYAGFMPNHPSMTRKLIPEENTPEWETMQREPEKFLLSMLSNAVQSRVNMTTIEILSTHAVNEEYLGQRPENWTDNPKVLAAFEKFGKKVDEIDALIKSRKV
ncbi:hypothetical protein M758_N011900 [Ceratodon purpureus]|nr:hypothetical protein M758_N011900 [Ceratodon purpureus]